MRRLLLALAVGLLAACSDTTRPADTPLIGVYQLTHVDGNPLPHSVVIHGEPAMITSGSLELQPANLMTLSLAIGTGTATSSSIALVGIHRRVTADSLVFPVRPAPEFFMKLSGSTLVLVSVPSGGVFSAAELIGGAHRLTFVVEP